MKTNQGKLLDLYIDNLFQKEITEVEKKFLTNKSQKLTNLLNLFYQKMKRNHKFSLSKDKEKQKRKKEKLDLILMIPKALVLNLLEAKEDKTKRNYLIF